MDKINVPNNLEAAWCAYVRQTRSFKDATRSGRQYRMLDLTEEERGILRDLAHWCTARDLYPVLWLWCTFQVKNWTWPPRLDPDLLMRQRIYAKLYRATRAAMLLERRRSSPPGDETPL